MRRTIGSTVTDIQLTSIGREEYLNIPTKETKGRPIEYFLDRQTTPVLYLWPTPENSTDIIVSNRIQRMDDISASVNDPDVPSRFMAPMVSGLAFYLAVKKNPERIAILKPRKWGESLNEMINFVEDFHLNMKYNFTIKFTSIIPVKLISLKHIL